MLTGADLNTDVDHCKVSCGQAALWWLGQHSFIVKLGKTVLYLDLFLTNLPDRLVPPMFKPNDIMNANYFLGSHDHLDHIDRGVWPALAKYNPQAKFIVPELLLPKLADDLKISGDRFIGLDDCRSIRLGDLKITGIAAAHEFLDRDRLTGGYPYLGFVIEGNGCTVYHSGDCCIYEGLQTKLKLWKFDIVLLPINGRDAKRLARGCLGNMTYQEAADLAGALEPKLTIPTHYDIFAMNSEDPKLFFDYMKIKYPHLLTVICEYGKCQVCY